VGLLLGTGLSAGGWLRVYITNGNPTNATAIALSLFAIVLSSTTLGTALPFTLARLGVDPANAGTSIQVRRWLGWGAGGGGGEQPGRGRRRRGQGAWRLVQMVGAALAVTLVCDAWPPLTPPPPVLGACAGVDGHPGRGHHLPGLQCNFE